jgi:dTDP-L-rhamnose 4-epimerase
MERILVTGGAGFIGSHTVDLLLRRGFAVRVLDSLAPPVHPDGRRPSYLPADVEFIRGDVRSHEELGRALRDVDAVIHLAAYQDYLTDFSKFFSVNTVGTALLYELIVEQGLPVRKVVVASSQSVYGEGAYFCPHDGVVYPPLRDQERLERRAWDPVCPRCGEEEIVAALSDESVVNPHNQYAISKYSQEMIALTLGQRYGIPSVAMRYSITQGPRQSFTNAYSGILRIFALRLLNGQSPVAYEDGNQLRDYVYVGDVAAANLLVLERDEANGKAFNVGGGCAVTVREYSEAIRQYLEAESPLRIPGEYRFGDTRHVLSDIGRLRSLGWQPRVALDRIIEEYVEWARRQPGARDYYGEAETVMKRLGTVRSTG